MSGMSHTRKILTGLSLAVLPTALLTAAPPAASAANCSHFAYVRTSSPHGTRYHTLRTNAGVTVKVGAYDTATAPSGQYFKGVYVHSGYDITMRPYGDYPFATYTATGWHDWGSKCFNTNTGDLDEYTD